MLLLTEKDFGEIKNWIYRNARPLELALWQYFFEGGGRDAVVTALACYQNADGGFGNALEPDNWNPNSSPYVTLYAINTLKSVGFTDIAHPIYQGIVRFLSSGVHFNESGWLFNIPSNNDYARAPWWTYSPEANTYESIGVTAEIAAFLLGHADQASGLYKRALGEARRIFGLFSKPGKYGDMGISGFCTLLEAVRQAGLEAELEAETAEETARKLVKESIVRDVSLWTTYCAKPSGFIKDPGSIYFRDNEDIVQTELDYLITSRPSGSVWDITWTWFDLSEVYPRELAVSANWWRSIQGIEKMRYLKSFGRLEV